MEISSGVQLVITKNQIYQVPLFTSGGVGLKNLVLFTSLLITTPVMCYVQIKIADTEQTSKRLYC